MAGRSGAKGKKAGKKSDVDKLKKELLEKDKKVEEYLERLKYLQADFDNYKKALDRERNSIVKSANEALVLKLLDVYENLERAIESGGENDGVRMVYEQMKVVLEGEGLKVIKTEGEKLDPFRHEAVMQEENKKAEDGTIIEELQRGYMLGEKVIRYSKVKVSKR